MKIKETRERECCAPQDLKAVEGGHTRIWCKNNMQLLEIHSAIAACNDHRTIGQMSEYDAKEIGWILETRKGGTIGFRAPKNTDRISSD